MSASRSASRVAGLRFSATRCKMKTVSLAAKPHGARASEESEVLAGANAPRLTDHDASR